MFVFLKDEEVQISETVPYGAEQIAEFSSVEKALDFVCGWQAKRIIELTNEKTEMQRKLTVLETKLSIAILK